MTQDYGEILKYGFYTVVIAGVAYGIYELILFVSKVKSSTAEDYAVSTSNPITQLGATIALQQGAASLATAAGLSNASNYNNAVVDFSPASLSLQQLAAISAMNNNAPVINATPAGVGSYGGNLDPSTYSKNAAGTATGTWAPGSVGNPYYSGSGYVGAGYYTAVANFNQQTGGVITYVGSQAAFNSQYK